MKIYPFYQSSAVLENMINSLDEQMKTVDADLKEVTKSFNFQTKGEMTKILMKPKSRKESKVENVKNLL